MSGGSSSIPPGDETVSQELPVRDRERTGRGSRSADSDHQIVSWGAADRASTTLPAGPTPASPDATDDPGGTDGLGGAGERLNTTLLGKYRIDKLLGEGGCGRVYLATHLQLRAQVAIKFLLSHWQNRAISRDRFRREARALALLSHPGIVRIHDFGEDAGDLYLIMEYLRGVPLSSLILTDGQTMPAARAAAIIDQILDVLSVAHERGIVHRVRSPTQCSARARPSRGGGDRGRGKGAEEATGGWCLS